MAATLVSDLLESIYCEEWSTCIYVSRDSLYVGHVLGKLNPRKENHFKHLYRSTYEKWNNMPLSWTAKKYCLWTMSALLIPSLIMKQVISRDPGI